MRRIYRSALFSLALGAASLAGMQSASAIGLLDNLPLGQFGSPYGTSTYGDQVMPPNDDGSSSRLNLPFTINFFGNSYNQFFINNNGNFTFNAGLSTFTPISFPVTNQPMIAPFWADVDTRSSIGAERNAVFVSSPNPNTVVATWHDVGYYSFHTDRLNDFQAVLINRSDVGPGDFDIVFRYNRLQWTTGDVSGGTPAQVGYDAGDQSHFFTLPGSRTGAVLNLQNTSNVSVNTPGLWLLNIRNGVIGDGSSPDAPLLPEIVTEQGWHFDFNIQVGQRIFIDPMIAIGYDYIVNSGPNIASVLLPAIAGDTDGYGLYLYNSVSGLFDIFLANLAANTQYSFGGSGVDRFAVRDIDVGLDPTDTTAFVTGLTFVDSGAVSMQQVPFVIDVAAVPEPSPLVLLLIGLASLVLVGMRRRVLA
jgi:hypothetical protein